MHAGIDTLRSKSLDRNSCESGDWFNRLDWTYRDNNFGVGLPPAGDNRQAWPLMRALLADPAIKPGAAEIGWTRDAFRDLLTIRASSALCRLRTADEVIARLRSANYGPQQIPTVIAGHLDGRGLAGANFAELLYLINVDKQAHELVIPAETGKRYALHPVHSRPGAADRRPAAQAHFDPASGRFTVPARTALVYVIRQAPRSAASSTAIDIGASPAPGCDCFVATHGPG